MMRICCIPSQHFDYKIYIDNISKIHLFAMYI